MYIIVIMFNNIVLLYFDHINAALLSLKDVV